MKSFIIGILAAILLLSPCKGFSETFTPEEITQWRRAAEQGNAIAQHNLGVAYSEGNGVGLNCAEGVRWFRMAAAQGDADALYSLGLMFENGAGVPEDYDEALRLYRLAARKGHKEAQEYLDSVGE